MPTETTDACPDCKGSMQLIRLVANSPMPGTTGEQMDLRYITARFDMTGVVKAFRCDRCSRIFLYG
jgi:hypothetical protein